MDETTFNLLLDHDPTDWSLRSIFADWLEERGRSRESFCQRWMAKWQRSPEHPLSVLKHRYQSFCLYFKISWPWWRRSGSYPNKVTDKPSYLYGLWDKIPRNRNETTIHSFDSRKEAEIALEKALWGLHLVNDPLLENFKSKNSWFDATNPLVDDYGT